MPPAATTQSKPAPPKNPSSKTLKHSASTTRPSNPSQDPSVPCNPSENAFEASGTPPRVRSRPPTASEERAYQAEQRRYDGLVLSLKDTLEVLGLIRDGRADDACALLRTVLNLQPPLPPPSDILVNPPRAEEVQPTQYEPHIEDESARGTILAQYYVDAIRHGYEIGLTFWQCAVWVTVFRDVHEEWISYCKSKKITDPKHCIRIFQSRITKTARPSSTSSHHPGGQAGDSRFPKLATPAVESRADSSPGPCFSSDQMVELAKYFVANYIQHIRLITFTFTQPQDIQFTRIVRFVEQKQQFQPLSGGIPEEEWEEYLRKVEEEEKERQEAIRREEERLRLEQEEKLKKELGEVAAPA
ncbi:hypothetical protein HK097_007745, partial [Rhizophlyctis rosea]